MGPSMKIVFGILDAFGRFCMILGAIWQHEIGLLGGEFSHKLRENLSQFNIIRLKFKMNSYAHTFRAMPERKRSFSRMSFR